jgi:hypothetical protein
VLVIEQSVQAAGGHQSGEQPVQGVAAGEIAFAQDDAVLTAEGAAHEGAFKSRDAK